VNVVGAQLNLNFNIFNNAPNDDDRSSFNDTNTTFTVGQLQAAIPEPISIAVWSLLGLIGMCVLVPIRTRG
jgi:hypothetical protein